MDIVGFIVTLLVGVACIVIGIMNTMGNISMLHSYHRSRVSKDDILPFGKRVGAGMIVLGASLSISAALMSAALIMDKSILTIIGTVIMFAGMTAGLIVIFCAMIKYNKGIF